MRKISIVFFLTVMVAVLLAACGGNEPTPPPVSTQPPAPPVVEETQPPAPEPTEEVMAGGPIDTKAYGSGDEVFSTDFDGEGEFDGDWSLLPFPSDMEDFEVSLDGFSHAYFEITDPTMDVLAIYDTDMLFFPRDDADVYVEATYENIGNNNQGLVSVVCRFSDEGFYMFSLMNGAKWYIYKYTFGKDWRKLLEGGVQNFDYEASHTIGGSCIGDELTLYVDGEEQKNAQYTESTFRDGGVGFGVSSDGRETMIEVDSFTASKP